MTDEQTLRGRVGSDTCEAGAGKTIPMFMIIVSSTIKTNLSISNRAFGLVIVHDFSEKSHIQMD